jgi:site-specific DNA-methyltransferase (adenine-specific)
LASDITTILQDELGFLLRGEVVWLKQRGSSGSCAWGSFRSPTNPVLRDTTERLIMASKGRFDRAIVPAKRAKRGLPSVSTSTSDEFIEATIDVWEIQPESATRVNHPAPFPVTLAERCIDLYSFKGDLILDPFMGSGSTAVAASRLSRSFVGFDTDENYVGRAMQRVADDGQPRTSEETRSIRDVVEEILTLNHFHKIVWGQKVLTGFEIAGKAIRPDGRTILFDIAGGLTNVRPGLSRGDLLWRAIGRAAVVTEVFPGERLVLFTSGLPEKLSGGNALAAVVGPGMPITAVIDVSDFESACHHPVLGA